MSIPLPKITPGMTAMQLQALCDQPGRWTLKEHVDSGDDIDIDDMTRTVKSYCTHNPGPNQPPGGDLGVELDPT
jgi:hypothetical protein